MLSQIRRRIQELFAEPGLFAVLGLVIDEDASLPALLLPGEELDRLTLEPKWPLAKTAWRFASALGPGQSLGLVCRGCDARAVIEMEKAGQIAPGRIRVIGVPCSAEQATACRCAEPFVPGQAPQPGVDYLNDPQLRELTTGPARLTAWMEHFARCIKCYGCRDACPLCLCPSCKLEDETFVALGGPPAEPVTFHLIRAMHLADRCVGCGACQEACPAGIPLLGLHLHLRRTLAERSGFVSGSPQLSPVTTALTQGGPLGAPAPEWTCSLAAAKPGGGHGR